MFTRENVAGNASLAHNQKNQEIKIILETLQPRFSVCKVTDYSGIDLAQPFCFMAATDEENSLVCPEALAPENTIERDDGWRGFRVVGQLDFSLIGILARILKLLAVEEIGIFAISTYNTDYILTKEENFEKAIRVLKKSGYEIKEQL
ncbi:MAG: ACT domain-containing protein [Parasporobacterium sp.]|nr:ACT domain-containing protein [Parasporobacterium sp.]